MNLSQNHKIKKFSKYKKNNMNNNNIDIINNDIKNLNKSINQTNKEIKNNNENYFINKLKIKQINYISNNNIIKKMMKKSDFFQLNYKRRFRKSIKDKIKIKENSKLNKITNLKNNNSYKSGINISIIILIKIIKYIKKI